MPRKIEYTVPPEYDGKKAVSFLRGYCGLSTRLLRSLKFSEDGMKLNGVHVRTIDRLKSGDLISINIPDDENSVEPLKAELDIVYEDDDIIVINKSPFMAMHPTHNHQGDTLANALAAYMLEKGRPITFRAVGRLDKGTSGLVVCALNPLSACKLSGKVKKEYVALVKGEPEDSGTVDVPVYRPDPMKTLRACSYELGVEPAVTHWTVIRRFEGAALIRLNLETGRTHQIRVHMAHIGHPLAGDNMYGDFMPEKGHQLLHCARCSFIHPVTREPLEFSGEFFPDFTETMNNLNEIE